MKLFALLISLMYACISSGQSLTEIRHLLSGRNFLILKDCVDSASVGYLKSQGQEGAIWKQLRDITPTYQEGWFYLIVPAPQNHELGKTMNDFYLVSILSTKSEIIYYQIIQQQIRKGLSDTFPLIDSFKNESELNQLSQSFERIYATPLDKNELLRARDYASQCEESVPEERIKLNMILEKKDVSSLDKWLKSANCETQVYAIEGLYQLSKDGYELTSEEKRIIEVVRNKNGTIGTCYDSVQNIKEVVSRFKF